MTRGFRFRLEKLRDLRVAEEQERARAVAVAREAVAEVDRVIEDLVEAEGALRRRMRVTLEEEPTVGQVQNIQVVVAQLRRQRAAADAERRRLVTDHEAAVERLHDAFRGREMLDRLKDKKRKVWSHAQSREEQKVIDEIGRGRGSGGSSPGKADSR